MAGYYDDLDLRSHWNGDFDLKSGDLADTAEDGLLSLKQQLHTIAASVFQDWEIYPNLGAGLDDFVGEANTRTNANAIHDRLRTSITSAGLVAESDLKIRVIPVHIYRVLVTIAVSVVPTPQNGLSNTSTLLTSLLFDFLEQGVFYLDKTPKLLGD